MLGESKDVWRVNHGRPLSRTLELVSLENGSYEVCIHDYVSCESTSFVFSREDLNGLFSALWRELRRPKLDGS